MVAGDGIWAHAGSMIAITQALGIKSITLAVTNSKMTTIIESGPDETNSSNFLKVFNTNSTHFYAAHCQNNNYSITNIQNDFGKNIPYMRYELFELYQNLNDSE